ncbi:hypothetical protein BCON_0236g00090 [Botryotinia convoluta]|uniref:Uncharacterized protein n=1 Tax=Botryotinia convoluta TaxID=54673 RepID=A0A4Z1HJ05_9HELO|nr:hypothetical protein BCON_0236g00090 [Botryotinia convoluta]
MDSSNVYQQRRSNLKFELDKRIPLLEEKVRDRDLRTEATSALRSLYAFRIANTYVDEAKNKFTSEKLTRKDIDNIHRDILNIQHISRQFVNDVYDIVRTPEAKIAEGISYFLAGEPITPALLNNTVQDASQANIARQIIRLDTLLGGVRNLEPNTANCYQNNFEMKINQTISTSKASAEASEGIESEIKRLQRRAALLEGNNKLLEMRTSNNKKEVAELKDDKPKHQAEIAALRKEKANGRCAKLWNSYEGEDERKSYEKPPEYGPKNDDKTYTLENSKDFLVKKHQVLMRSMVGMDGFDPKATVWQLWRKAEEVLRNSKALVWSYSSWLMTKHHIEQINSEVKESTEQVNLQKENSDSINLQPIIGSDNAQSNNFTSLRIANSGVQGVQRPAADSPVLYLAQAPTLEAFEEAQKSGHSKASKTDGGQSSNILILQSSLRSAINSQLELEKATESLIKNVYKDLKRMKAAGCSSEDWIAIFDKAQQLVDTFRMLTIDEGPISTAEERKVVVKVEQEAMNGGEPEEDIEEYLEVLLKEIYPNLDQIRAAASLEKEELHDVFGLAKQMAEPHKFTFDGEMKKVTIEEKKNNRVKRNKKKNRKGGKRKYERKGGASCLSTKN